MKKILYSLFILLSFTLMSRNIFAKGMDKISVDDVSWSWKGLSSELSPEGGYQRNILAQYIRDKYIGTEAVQAYLKKCRMTDEAFIKILQREIFDNLKGSVTEEDGTEVVKLKTLLNRNGNELSDRILLEYMIDKYDLLVSVDDTELVTKATFDKFIKDKDEESQKKLKQAFARMYYVQTNVERLRDALKEIISEDEYQADDLEGIDEKYWVTITKDSYIYRIIAEYNLNVKNAKPYDKLPEDTKINASEEFDPAYVYFFASDEDVEAYKFYNDTMKVIEKWQEYNGDIKGTISGTLGGKLGHLEKDSDEYRRVLMRYTQVYSDTVFHPGESARIHKKPNYVVPYIVNTTNVDDDVIRKVEPNANYREMTINSNKDILTHKVDFASFLVKYGNSLTGYGNSNNVYSLEDAVNVVNRGLELAVESDQQLYEFNMAPIKGDIVTNYFVDTSDIERNSVLIDCGNDFSVFDGLFDKIEDDVNDKYTKIFSIIAVRGNVEIINNKKVFVYDEKSDNLYHIYRGSGSDSLYSLHAPLKKENVNTKENSCSSLGEVLANSNFKSEENEVKGIYIRGYSGKNYVLYGDYYWADLENAAMTPKLQDLYNDLKARYNKELEAMPKVKDMVGSVSYKDVTINALREKLKAQKFDDGSSRKCPDEVSNEPICKDGWWSCAWQFLNHGKDKHIVATKGVDDAISEIRSLIFDVGNIIFILVTAYLGVKYIWGGVESKFTVKNSLLTLVVAASVFYGWDAIANILNVQNILTGTASSVSHMALAGRIYNTIMYIVNIAAVAGIIYIGVRYMMAGADGKSEIKLKAIPVMMGIIMVYGTLNLINFILDIIESVV